VLVDMMVELTDDMLASFLVELMESVMAALKVE
jgi:hypothetical protein